METRDNHLCAAPLTLLRPSSALRSSSPKTPHANCPSEVDRTEPSGGLCSGALSSLLPPLLSLPFGLRFILPSPHSRWEHGICQEIACGPTVQTLTVRSSRLNTSLGKQVRRADCNWLVEVWERPKYGDRESPAPFTPAEEKKRQQRAPSTNQSNHAINPSSTSNFALELAQKTKGRIIDQNEWPSRW